MPLNDDRLLLSVKEFARVAGISPGHAYNLIGAGEIPALRLGKTLRVPVEALRETLAKKLIGAEAQ